MMTTTRQHPCRKCGSQNMVKHGHNRSGSQHSLCKDGRTIGVLIPKPPTYRPERREDMLRAYQERPRMRGIKRLVGVSRNTRAAGI